MSKSKKNDAAARIRYEPPALLDLGIGVAHAQTPPCMGGGSPDGKKCQSGSVAIEKKCQFGGTAGGKCQGGTTAASGKCMGGSLNAVKCNSGDSR